MPIYPYKCQSCGYSKDVLQKISDPLLTQCPQCGAEAFQKQLTAAGFQLKGSGWYVTDFRDKKTDTTSTKPDNTHSKGTDTEKGSASSETSSTTTETSASTAASPALAPAPAPTPASSNTPQS